MWIDAGANKKRILDEQYFGRMIDNCIAAGFDSIILSAKDTAGFGLYKSSIVPHKSLYDPDFQDIDYLRKYTVMAHEKGIKIYAAVDVFSEGRKKNSSRLSPGFAHPEWQTEVYGIDGQGKPAIKPISDTAFLRTTGSIDDFGEIFVNPARDDVREYELSAIEELINNYDIDGIVLDRVRFIGISSDFSSYTKEKFEAYIGGKVENWPEDIYKLKQHDEKIVIEYGSLFGRWITFRARTIKKFVMGVEEVVKSCKRRVELIDYTGSWYPLYYLVGANWASEKYTPEDYYPWVGSEYSNTGYAEHIDKLLSGFYYYDVTTEDALRSGKPEYWYSVEGSGVIAGRAVMGAVPYVGSLFVPQYKDNPDTFKRAIEMCFKKSNGCMIFDLCYVDDYNWWDLCK